MEPEAAAANLADEDGPLEAMTVGGRDHPGSDAGLEAPAGHRRHAMLLVAALLVLYVPYALWTMSAASAAGLVSPAVVLVVGMALMTWLLVLMRRGSRQAEAVALLTSALLVAFSALMYVLSLTGGDPSNPMSLIVLGSGAVSFALLGTASRDLQRGRAATGRVQVLIRGGQGFAALILAAALATLAPAQWVPSVGAWAFAFFIEGVRILLGPATL